MLSVIFSLSKTAKAFCSYQHAHYSSRNYYQQPNSDLISKTLFFHSSRITKTNITMTSMPMSSNFNRIFHYISCTNVNHLKLFVRKSVSRNYNQKRKWPPRFCAQLGAFFNVNKVSIFQQCIKMYNWVLDLIKQNAYICHNLKRVLSITEEKLRILLT